MPGHSTCDGGIVIDLRELSRVAVDPVTQRAIVGGGALLGDVDRATQRHGLVVPVGVVSHTGVGGNFGVATEFEFALHELSELVILATFHPLDQARRVIGQGRREMADPAARDELLWTSFLRRASEVPWMPPELVGRHGIMSLVEWSGDAEEGQAVLATIMHELEPAATAFPFRNARWLINIPATWRDAADDEREIDWARATYAAIRPHLSEGGYVNFMGDDEDDDTAAAYGRTIEGLRQVKAVYDPANVFRLNQNIEPAAAPA